ncbi:MAG TPA: molybdopterin cofactor-binding domain-containing protein, partial [Gaiellaceae bacterium]
MQLTVNGRPVDLEPRDGQSLLELLREELELRSMKDGCAPEGSCGACTVLVDGRAVVSCAQKATRVEGRHVVTQEGLSPETRKLWADCFGVAGASQCGFCSPGIVMKSEALLAKNPTPARAEIAHALLGNLCRCTGYVKIIDAVQLAAGARRGEPLPEPGGDGVGERALRYRADELALGDKPFVADLREPGMLHGALRSSDHPRARVLRIDTAKAKAYPGVIDVLTAADVPGKRMLGSLKQDWRQLVAVGETTSYVGDVIAAVAAETRHAAREAAALVEVEYEVLEPVTSPFTALAADAPLLHEDGNVLSTSTVKRGDVDTALASAAHVVNRSFRTQFIEHAFLEPEAALAVPADDGTLRVYSQGQGVWDDRRQIAQFLAVPDERVRVTQVSSGGAFGAKEDLNVQGHAALLAVKTRRPVLLALSRKESLSFHAKRHAMWLDYTAACDANGRLLAVRARIVGDTGAYASVGDKVLERAAGHACSAYGVDNVDVEATAVYTNNPPCGAMRGFGVNQSNFAMEGVLDELAELVGIDGWEIRWRNALDTGDRTTTGQLLGPGVGLKRTLRAVEDAYRNA